MQEWQTIENVPTDGTPVWIYNDADQICIATIKGYFCWKTMKKRRYYDIVFAPLKIKEGAAAVWWAPLPDAPRKKSNVVDLKLVENKDEKTS